MFDVHAFEQTYSYQPLELKSWMVLSCCAKLVLNGHLYPTLFLYNSIMFWLCTVSVLACTCVWVMEPEKVLPKQESWNNSYRLNDNIIIVIVTHTIKLVKTYSMFDMKCKCFLQKLIVKRWGELVLCMTLNSLLLYFNKGCSQTDSTFADHCAVHASSMNIIIVPNTSSDACLRLFCCLYIWNPIFLCYFAKGFALCK